MNILYSIDHQRFYKKLTNKDVANLHFEWRKAPFEELTEHIESGKSFTCQVYHRNMRATVNFSAQNIFAFDFDNTLTLDQISLICKDYGIDYNMYYPTFSHTDDKPRYRIIFFCKGEVRCLKLAENIIESFNLIFDKKCDQNALDLARVWAGTDKKVTYYSNSLFDPRRVLEIANAIKYSNQGNRANHLFPVEKLIEDEKEGNLLKAIVYYYRKDHNSTIIVENEDTGRPKVTQHWKIEDLLECKLFKTFYEGGGTPTLRHKKLYDDELCCLASNLLLLKGGAKLYKQCLDKNPHYSCDKYSKISYLKHRDDYNTFHICNYSPFPEDADLKTFDDLLKKRGKVSYDEDFSLNLISLQEAEEKLQVENKRIFESDDNNVYLIKATPGLGKTEFWKNKIGIAIGFPTNDLKDEHYKDSKLSSEKKLVTPDVHRKFSRPIREFLDALYQKGDNEAVYYHIKRMADMISPLDNLYLKDHEIDAANYFLNHTHNIRNADPAATIFTTHARLLHQKFQQNTYVFDENFLSTLFEDHRIKIDELVYAIHGLQVHGINTKLIEAVLKSEKGKVYSTPNFNISEKILKDIVLSNSFTTNVLKFFCSSHYIIDEKYIKYQINYLNKIPQDKKIIILDGTGSEAIYGKIFGERLKVIDISNVKNQGRIIQHTLYACSRSAFKDRKYLKRIAEQVGDRPVLTYKHYKQYFSNFVDMHFGDLRGSNKLSGKNFCVAGKLTYHVDYYKFLAKALNIETEDFKMDNHRVKYRGMIFQYYTFEHPDLQQMHLEQVEGDLLQAVHRGRLIRMDAIVELFTNFPLLQAEFV